MAGRIQKKTQERWRQLFGVNSSATQIANVIRISKEARKPEAKEDFTRAEILSLLRTLDGESRTASRIYRLGQASDEAHQALIGIAKSRKKGKTRPCFSLSHLVIVLRLDDDQDLIEMVKRCEEGKWSLGCLQREVRSSIKSLTGKSGGRSAKFFRPLHRAKALGKNLEKLQRSLSEITGDDFKIKVSTTKKIHRQEAIAEYERLGGKIAEAELELRKAKMVLKKASGALQKLDKSEPPSRKRVNVKP